MANASLKDIRYFVTGVTLLACVLTACEENRRICTVADVSGIVGGQSETLLNESNRLAVVRIDLSTSVDDFVIEQQCSGIAISPNHVLTAAHCFSRANDWQITVGAVGRVDESTSDRCTQPWQETSGMLVAVHEQKDVAIVETTDVLPMHVTNRNESTVAPGATGVIAGYGLDEDNTLGRRLFLETSIVSVDNEILRVGVASDAGACVGDSGGPLFVKVDETRYVLAGTLSKGSPSCTGEDEYVNLFGLHDWINTVLATR